MFLQCAMLAEVWGSQDLITVGVIGFRQVPSLLCDVPCWILLYAIEGVFIYAEREARRGNAPSRPRKPLR